MQRHSYAKSLFNFLLPRIMPWKISCSNKSWAISVCQRGWRSRSIFLNSSFFEPVGSLISCFCLSKFYLQYPNKSLCCRNMRTWRGFRGLPMSAAILGTIWQCFTMEDTGIDQSFRHGIGTYRQPMKGGMSLPLLFVKSLSRCLINSHSIQSSVTFLNLFFLQHSSLILSSRFP